MSSKTNSKKPKKSLVGRIYEIALEKFPSIEDADLDDLDAKGFAAPLMLVFYGVFFGTFAYFAYANATQNINTRFLSPTGENNKLVCESVPVTTEASLQIDATGLWSTEIDFKDSTALYSIDMNQAKYHSDPWNYFLAQLKAFQSNFREQTDRGLNRDFAWNLVFSMTYKDTRGEEDGELEAGTTSFSLTGDARIAFDRANVIGLFSSKKGLCMPQDDPVLDADGHLIMRFQQRFPHGEYGSYYPEYAENFAPSEDFGYSVTDDNTPHYDFDYEYEFEEFYDFNYVFYYYDLGFWYTHDAIFAANHTCSELVNAADLGYTSGILGSSGYHNQLEVDVDLASAMVAIAVNFKILKLSELTPAHIPPPQDFRKRYGSTFLTVRFYFHEAYTPMDPVLCVTDDQGTSVDDSDDIPFCLVKLGRLYAFPITSNVGVSTGCGGFTACSCENYRNFTSVHDIQQCDDIKIAVSLVFYQHDRDARQITKFARRRMKDYHSNAEFDVEMVALYHDAFSQASYAFLAATILNMNRLGQEFSQLWYTDFKAGDSCTEQSVADSVTVAYDDFCDDGCTLLTFVLVNQERYHILNEHGLSGHTLQCSDNLYNHNALSAMLDTRPDITMTQSYEICRYTLLNAVTTGIATAFSSATFYSSIALIVSVMFVVKGYNFYHHQKKGRKFFQKVSAKEKFEKESVRRILRGLVSAFPKDAPNASEHIQEWSSLLDKMDRLEDDDPDNDPLLEEEEEAGLDMYRLDGSDKGKDETVSHGGDGGSRGEAENDDSRMRQRKAAHGSQASAGNGVLYAPLSGDLVPPSGKDHPLPAKPPIPPPIRIILSHQDSSYSEGGGGHNSDEYSPVGTVPKKRLEPIDYFEYATDPV